MHPALVLLLALCTLVFAASPDEWKSRAIYQVLTDRISRGNNDTSPCPALGWWCGGTFQGLIQQLDYITGMGFDAIWIGPVVLQTAGGYHGYYAKNLYQVDPHLGTTEDLEALVAACHQRNMFVMLDVVANHMGCDCSSCIECFAFSNLVPFSSAADFHSYCIINDWNNQTEIELCRLGGLPDLNQTQPSVRSALLDWVTAMVSNYSFDGLRVDTVQEVHTDFWAAFQQSAGVYAVGEVDNGALSVVAPYQSVLDATLHYPMFWVLRSAFAPAGDLRTVQQLEAASALQFRDVSVLGLFCDNHDNPRFLNASGVDTALYRNALAYVLSAPGMPIIYYGSEQAFHGGPDPNCRETLWPHYNRSSILYRFISTVLAARNCSGWALQPHLPLYTATNLYIYARGSAALVALTNGGASAPLVSARVSIAQQWPDGEKLCNIFDVSDCILTFAGTVDVSLENGLPKLYIPA